MRREWIEMYNIHNIEEIAQKSPSMRREWIEIATVLLLNA